MKIVVIGLDSASWNLLMPWIEAGTLPTIGGLVANGVRGYLRSCVPPITFPAWKCYSTGKNPGKLGVYSFTGLDKDKRELIVHSGADFREKEIWDYLGYNGLRSCVINMPGTYPPREINGIMVSGHPAISYKDYARPRDILPELHKLGYKVNADIVPGTWRNEREHRHLRELISSRFDIAKIIRDNYDIDFWHLTVLYIDKIQHSYYKNEGVLKDYWSLIDARIGEFLEGFSSDTTVFLMSDHGATEIKNTLYLNEFLLKNGYLQLTPAGGENKLHAAGAIIQVLKMVRRNRFVYPYLRRLRRYAPRVLNEFVKSISKREKSDRVLSRVDWEKSDFVALGNGSCLIYRLNGQPESMQELRALLEQLQDPITGDRVADVFARDEVYTGHMKNAPDMIVVPRANTMIAERVRREPVLWGKSPNRWEGMHEQEGMFLACGPHIQQGQEVSGATIFDLAPTILHLFDTPIPKDMDGRVLQEIFSAGSDPACRQVRYREIKDEKQEIREQILKLKASGRVK